MSFASLGRTLVLKSTARPQGSQRPFRRRVDRRRTPRQRSDMRWRDRLGDVLDDLELQAEGLALAARDAEVAEQSRAEYASVDLPSRLHGSPGARLFVTVRGIGSLEGVLGGVGAGWLLVDTGTQECVVRLAAVLSLRG